MIPYCGIVRKAEAKKKIDDKVDRVLDNNGKMSDTVAGAAPGTSVDVYNNSRKRKREATVGNWAAKIAAGGAGAGAGYMVYRKTKGKIKPLTVDGKKLTAEKKQGFASSAITSVGATTGGYAGSRAHQEYVKRSDRYNYKEK